MRKLLFLCVILKVSSSTSKSNWPYMKNHDIWSSSSGYSNTDENSHSNIIESNIDFKSNSHFEKSSSKRKAKGACVWYLLYYGCLGSLAQLCQYGNLILRNKKKLRQFKSIKNLKSIQRENREYYTYKQLFLVLSNLKQLANFTKIKISCVKIFLATEIISSLLHALLNSVPFNPMQ